MKESNPMTPQEFDADLNRRVKEFGDLDPREYDIPGLPTEEGPLTAVVKFPTETEFTERIGNTEYTVKARFRPHGRDLLCTLNALLAYGVAPKEKRQEKSSPAGYIRFLSLSTLTHN